MRWLVALLAFVPLPALALSCLPHGVTDAYLAAEAAEDSYIPVLGTFTFDEGLMPKEDWDNQQDVPPTTLVPAAFDGVALTQRGIDLPFRADVVLEVTCFGPWCPSPRSGPALIFLRRTVHSYVASTDACGGYVFGAPTEAQVQEVRDCLAGRSCRPWADR